MVNIQVRVDEHLRDQAQQILSQIGMDMTTALTSSPPSSLDHPPAVKRSTAVFDSGTEGCLRQPQATRGQVLRV